jgi:RNA polymerase sigma-70 factor (ECF subfamily)
MDLPELHEFVLKAKKGDKAAFGYIFDACSDRIFRYIRIKVNEQEQAEDVLQEVFIKAWRGLPKLSEENLNFLAWLYKIAGNTINDHFRKMYRSPKTTSLEESMDMADPNSPNDAEIFDAAIIVKCLDYLPIQYKEIIELRFIQDFDIETTAKALGKTSIAVRVGQHRALKRLREVVEEKFKEQPHV